MITAVDSPDPRGIFRVHADFPGFDVLANTPYWIGMAGTLPLTQAGLSGIPGGDRKMAPIDGGNHLQFMADTGDMAFRLYGRANVPEPATFALLGLGIVGLAASRRHKLG